MTSYNQQLTLNVQQRLAYAPENFLIHNGIAKAFSVAKTVLAQEKFSLVFIFGSPRSGKTHFSIRLAHELALGEFYPHLIEGESFSEILSQEEQQVGSHDIFIVDNAHIYLKRLRAGDSGPLVNFIERARVVKARLILFSSLDIDAFSFDQHLLSRFQAGMQLSLDYPAETDMAELVALIAKQRGIKLSTRQINFLLKRLGRELVAIEAYLDRVEHLSKVLGKSIKFPLLGDAV